MAWIPFPLDSNKLPAFRNKYAEVNLIILNEILMISKTMFYQMHCFLLEIFNWPNLPFAESLALTYRNRRHSRLVRYMLP